MLSETADYQFEPGKIYNLEASQFIKRMDGMSEEHSDIDGPQVAHAIWQAALASITASATAPPPSRPCGSFACFRFRSERGPFQSRSSLRGRDADSLRCAGGDGQYLPPIKESDLDHIGSPHNSQIRAQNAGSSHLAAIAEVQPDDLSLTGWGVIF